jgi:1-phosphatidylinositol phosphodiesterase
MKDKKIFFTSIGIILLALIISIFAMVPIDKSHDAYSKNWLKNVDDNAKITEVSLPGTHDSGATHSIADVAGKCQDLSIKTQLEIGVRFFDLRLQLVNDEFKIVHSFVDQNLKFSTVLKDLYSFIKENSSEYLIISIKEEASPVNSTLWFDEALIRDFEEYKDVFMINENKLPETVKEARGKIYLLSRFSGDIGIPAHYGWADDCSFEFDNIFVQDNYNIQNIEDKKSDILNAINYANTTKNKLVLNFTSCYLDPGFPPLYAGTAALAINPWFLETIKETKDNLGIIVADFITESLAKAIYMRNI